MRGPLRDRQRLRVKLDGLGVVLCFSLDVPELLKADAQIPLGLGVARIRRRLTLPDVLPLLVEPTGLVYPAKLQYHVPQFVEADAQVPLGLGVAWVRCR